ncbi:hypothetical protein [Fibrella aquatilis]|uniref:Uncharacterized protein n=1 Tax=Fibrella aquatilis TaxID=2817059 RepID=A0A939JYQ3_9BACT|nr:hypothetical protein [Fibrella aquatilis]MBO0932349.1 hypothetical protein [Fibrella aquatilis]
MSHSLRRTPIFGFTTGTTEKLDKRWANRRVRRRNRIRVQAGYEPILLREVSNVWAFKKDGKVYHRDPPHTTWMRK